jgi:transposase
MGRYIDGQDRTQSVLFPERLDDWIDEGNPVRAVDVFVDALDLVGLGFERAQPAETGRPGYHPATLLKIYIYGYLNRVQSSRRLEREAQRNVELVWLTGRLMPDFKTIADFRKDNGEAIRTACREFVLLCRGLGLFEEATVAIDGSKFKAVNNRDKNFTERKLQARMQQLDESVQRYLTELDRADRDPSLVTEARVEHLKDKLARVKEQAGNTIQTVCVDVANGYTKAFISFIHKLRKAYPEITIMAGNVVTGEMTEELILDGVDIVKVGIGPGSVCTTRKMSGVGYPQLSAIIECADAAHGLHGLICADGGCTSPGDLAKAFGAGADFIMLGGMLAGHDECMGEVAEQDGVRKVRFYGMSSRTEMD